MSTEMNIKNYLEKTAYVLTAFELKNSKLKLDSLKVFTDLFKGFLKELTGNENRTHKRLINDIKRRAGVVAERLQRESYDFAETLEIYEAIIKNIARSDV
jgi:hypothetical protein